MQTDKQHTLKTAFWHSPGPHTLQQFIALYFKGMAMGSADIIPGVSGGTIALIVGIYSNLLDAIQSFNGRALGSLSRLKISQALAEVHLRFLMPLLMGIASAVIALSHIVHILLNHYPAYTWSFFFGLILASIPVIGKQIDRNASGLAGFFGGLLFGFFLVGMIPVQTPEASWFIFLAGMIAICAMILPGISGAFILLILGKYEYVTSALKNPFAGQNILIILVFAAGAIVGILSFSRLLNSLLKKHHNLTIAILTGLMAGSLRKIWPWKQTLETVTIRGKVHVLREANILPPNYDSAFYLSLLLILVGFVLVFALEKMAGRPKE